MHKSILSENKNYTEPEIFDLYKRLNLDTNIYRQSLSDSELIKKHAINRSILNEIGINTVPCYIINGSIINNLTSVEQYLSYLYN